MKALATLILVVRDSFGLCWIGDERWPYYSAHRAGLCLVERGRVEAFGEPAVDFGEHSARLVAASSTANQPSETHGRAQFQRFGALSARNLNRPLKATLSFRGIGIVLLQQQLAFEPMRLLNVVATRKSGVLDLKCPCGTIILPSTPVISSLKDRQRGLLKSRIERHLRAEHGLSEHSVRVIINQAFATN
jgi:hypothetical protein